MTTQVFPDNIRINSIPIYVSPRIVIGSSPKFDFETGEFVIENGDLTLVSGMENLKQWVTKAVSTPRYYHPIYTWQFGNEVNSLMGVSITSIAARSITDLFIKEALLYDRRIKDVVDVETTVEQGKLFVDFKVVTIDNKYLEVNTELVE